MTEETTTAEGATTFRHRSGQSLRQRAEEVVQKRPEEMEEIAAGDIQDLIHELQVHQVELEIQNEELRQAQQALERSRDRYSDLYEFAPVGYLTLDRKGLILEANLTLATLLGVERATLIERPLSRFIVSEDQDVYYHHRRRLFKTQQPQSCELRMVRGDGSRFWVRIEARAALNSAGQTVCRATLSDVTARKRAEEALEEERAFLSTVLENIEEAIIICDAEGRIVRFNKAARRLHGVPEEPIPPEKWAAYYDLYQANRVTPLPTEEIPLFRALQDEHVQDAEIVVNPEHSDPRSLVCSGQALTDAAGEITGAVVTMHDITERKQMEEALQESLEKYRILFESFPIGITVADNTGQIIETNKQSERLLGVLQEEHQARRIDGEAWQIVRPDGSEMPPEEYASVRALREDRLIENVEMGIIKPDGDVTCINVTAAPLGDQVIITYNDITAHKRAEEALRQQKELLESALESLTHPFLVIDAEDYTVELANSAALPADGLTEGMTCHQLTHRRDTPCGGEHHPCPLEKVKATQAPVKMEHVHYAQDGSRQYVELHGYPILGEDGNVVQMIEYALDVTARKQMEAELKRSNEELEQFAYVIAHDLREPARIVTSYMNLLVQRYQGQLDEKADMFIDYAVDGAERMQEMINALLDLSRIGRRGKEPAPTDADAVLERTLRSLGRAIEDAEAEVTSEPLPTVVADEAQLAQVFQNLIANAIKFRREDAPPHVHVSAEREGDEWLLSVADNGIGIDPEQADRIFQVFQRLHTEEEYPGLGIGLALCKRIVERHDGRIWVESEVGEGSTFYFTIPA